MKVLFLTLFFISWTSWAEDFPGAVSYGFVDKGLTSTSWFLGKPVRLGNSKLTLSDRFSLHNIGVTTPEPSVEDDTYVSVTGLGTPLDDTRELKLNPTLSSSFGEKNSDPLSQPINLNSIFNAKVNCSKYFRDAGVGERLDKMAKDAVKSLGISQYVPFLTKPFIAQGSSYSRDDITNLIRKKTGVALLDLPPALQHTKPVKCELSNGKNCSKKVLNMCFDKEIVRKVQLVLAQRMQDNLTKARTRGCFNSKEGMNRILSKDFLQLISKFDLKSCLTNGQASCQCLRKKKRGVQESLFLPEDAKKEILATMVAQKLVDRVADIATSMNTVIKVERMLKLQNSMTSQDQDMKADKLRKCKALVEPKNHILEGLLTKCGTNAEGSEKEKMSIINKIFMKNSIVASPIKSKQDFVTFFQGYFAQINEKSLYDIESERKEMSKLYHDLDSSLMDEIKSFLIKIAEDRAKGGEMFLPDSEHIEDALDDNPLYEYSDFAFCIGETPDDDCYDQLFQELGLNPHAKDLAQQLKDQEVSSIRVALFKEALPSYEESCNDVFKELQNVCTGLMNVSLKDFKGSDINAAYNIWLHNKKYSQEQKEDLRVQREMLKCAQKDPTFSQYLNKKEDVSDVVPTLNNIFKNNSNLVDIQNTKTSSMMNLSTQIKGAGKMKQGFFKDVIQKHHVKGVVEDVKNLSDLKTKGFQDTLSSHYASNGPNLLGKRSKSGGSVESSIDPFESQQMVTSLNSHQLNNLSNLAEDKVDRVATEISDREKRIRELEDQLQNRDKPKQVGETHSDSNSELMKMLDELRGEVSSLKKDLSVAKERKQQVEKAVQQQKKVESPIDSGSSIFADRTSGASSGVVSEQNRGNVAEIPQATKAINAGDVAVLPRSTSGMDTRVGDSGKLSSSYTSTNSRTSVGSQYVSLEQLPPAVRAELDRSPLLNYEEGRSLLAGKDNKSLFEILGKRGVIRIDQKNGYEQVIIPIKKNGQIVGIKKILKPIKNQQVVKKKSNKKKLAKKKIVKKKSRNSEKSRREAYYSLLQQYFSH